MLTLKRRPPMAVAAAAAAVAASAARRINVRKTHQVLCALMSDHQEKSVQVVVLS